MLDDPLRFWDTLETASPDLLILDVDMPALNGIELCHIIRADPRRADLPVLFLTLGQSSDIAERIFSAGADDFVAKPVVGPELVTRVTNRLERVRLMRTQAEIDLLTGVANRRKGERDLDRYLRLARRQRLPLCLAVIDLDHFKGINDRFGHAAGDSVLRRVAHLLQQGLRAEDVVARWGGEEFVVGMYNAPRDDGARRVATLLDTVREQRFSGADGTEFAVTFSAGVAAYPDDAADLNFLYRAADGALFTAKAAGRDQVATAGTEPENVVEEERSVDVAVVEDDPALASLLLHALHNQGYRTRWIADGQTAAELLGGPSPALKTRVVLLDVDLPGLDGMAVLRRLGRDGTLRATRVIMLTVRSTESETVQALDMGAFDHVAKPFSVPVLMLRVRRALHG